MGTFKVEIVAAGGHGCQRDRKDGEHVYGCGNMACPDCRTREFVDRLKRMGCHMTSAVLTHWPGEPSEVRDDLLTNIRSGSF